MLEIVLLSLSSASRTAFLFLATGALCIAASLECALYQSPSVLFTLVTKAAPLITADHLLLQFALQRRNDLVFLVANACITVIHFFVLSSAPNLVTAIGNLMVYLDHSGEALGSTALSVGTIQMALTPILIAMETIKYTDIKKEVTKDVQQKQQRGVANSYATMD